MKKILFAILIFSIVVLSGCSNVRCIANGDYTDDNAWFELGSCRLDNQFAMESEFGFKGDYYESEEQLKELDKKFVKEQLAEYKKLAESLGTELIYAKIEIERNDELAYTEVFGKKPTWFEKKYSIEHSKWVRQRAEKALKILKET